jgi:hypothetical protein
VIAVVSTLLAIWAGLTAAIHPQSGKVTLAPIHISVGRNGAISIGDHTAMPTASSKPESGQ